MPLAQLNIAEMIEPMDSERMKDFVDSLDMVNQEAEASEGFIWRYKDNDEAVVVDRHIFENDMLIINLSVWKDENSLKNFVYSGNHLKVYKRKKEWFHKMKQAYMVLWHVKEGHTPDLAEAKQKLDHYRLHGATEEAFGFKRQTK